MTFEEHLVPWRVTPQVLAEWCAWQVQHHPQSAAYCEAILRMVAHKVWSSNMPTHDAEGGWSCSS